MNTEIKATLQTANKRPQFPILNNGITIVARDLMPLGEKITISDFQIVNGCQTCNVLYDNRKYLGDNEYCTVKIISTTDREVINDIIRSTNKQSEVLDEAFESLKEIHKTIQSFFESFSPDQRLYYERRAREFDYIPGIESGRVVTLTTLINSHMAMFHDEPHSIHRYYGELLKSNSDKLFQPDDLPIVYYTPAWALQKIDKILNSRKEFMTLKKYRFHILMMMGHIDADRPNPLRKNSRSVEKYCNDILKAVNDKAEFESMLVKCMDALEKTIPTFEQNERNPINRHKDFTEALLKALQS